MSMDPREILTSHKECYADADYSKIPERPEVGLIELQSSVQQLAELVIGIRRNPQIEEDFFDCDVPGISFDQDSII